MKSIIGCEISIKCGLIKIIIAKQDHDENIYSIKINDVLNEFSDVFNGLGKSRWSILNQNEQKYNSNSSCTKADPNNITRTTERKVERIRKAWNNYQNEWTIEMGFWTCHCKEVRWFIKIKYGSSNNAPSLLNAYAWTNSSKITQPFIIGENKWSYGRCLRELGSGSKIIRNRKHLVPVSEKLSIM